jgi:hypothetical protein
MDDRSSIPARGSEFFSHRYHVQTGFRAHQAPVQWVMGILSLENKLAGS